MFSQLKIRKVDEEKVDFHSLQREIQKIVSKVKIKRRTTNLEHLVIAKKFGLIFLTGDKEVIEKCKWFYPNVWSYVEFVKHLKNGC